MESLIDDRAILGDEEDDEDFDEETGEEHRKANGTNGRFEDSSDEEEDDDDEEAAKVRFLATLLCSTASLLSLTTLPGSRRLHRGRR